MNRTCPQEMKIWNLLIMSSTEKRKRLHLTFTISKEKKMAFRIICTEESVFPAISMQPSSDSSLVVGNSCNSS